MPVPWVWPVTWVVSICTSLTLACSPMEIPSRPLPATVEFLTVTPRFARET
jgi:hypothetical protein